MPGIPLINAKCAFVPLNDVALDRTDINLIPGGIITLVALEDVALLKDDEVILLGLSTEVVPLELVVD